MTVLVIDYSLARPSPAAIKGAGYTAVLRYLSGNAAPGKDLTAAEAAALHAAGLGIGLIWETTAARALGGAAAGEADGALAVRQAQQLGYPAGCVLFANLGDFAATANQLDAVHAYYYAFRRVPGFVFSAGGYATSYIIGGLVARGAEGCWWQNAMDDGGVSGSVVSPHASIYQRVRPTLQLAGGGFDEDVVIATAPAPKWWTGAAAPPPPPPARPSLAEAEAAAKVLAAYFA